MKMKKKSKKRLVVVIVTSLVAIIMFNFAKGTLVEAKAIEGTRIMNLKQNINGKEYYIGCRMEGCDKHSGKYKYSEQPCSSGSDLKNIYVGVKGENQNTQWKTLDELKFTSVQGGCISNNILLLAFVDKEKIKKEI